MYKLCLFDMRRFLFEFFVIWKKPFGLKWKTPTENATTKNMLVQLQNDPPRKIEWQKFIDNNENPSTRLKN